MRFDLYRFKGVLKSVLSVVAVLAAWTILLYFSHRLLLGSGYAFGVDVRGHMYTSKYIADYLVAHHSLPAINPYWYAGFEIFHNTLWLAYVPVIMIYLIVGSAPLASRIFPVVMMFAYALTMFIAIRRGGSGALNGFIGAVAFSLAPAIVGNFGSQTKALAIVFMPLAFYFTNRLLQKKGRYNLLWLSIISALMLFSHPMIGIVTLSSLMFYSLIYILFSRSVSINRLLLVGLAFVVAGLLLSWYLIPSFFEHLTQSVATENLKRNSISLRGLFYGFGIASLGITFLVLAAVSTLRHRNPRSIALFITSSLGLVLALGIYGPIYRIIPIPIYPYLWLVFSIFGFIYLAVTAIDLHEIIQMPLARKFIAIPLVLIALVAIAWSIYAPTRVLDDKKRLEEESPPMRSLTTVPASTATTNRMLQKLKILTNPGRIYTTEETNTDYILMGISEAKKPNVEGAYYLASSLGRELAWIKDATKYRYLMYVVKRFSHMNIRYLLVSKSLPKTFVAHMQRDGFKKVEEFDVYQVLYVKDKESSYFIPLEESALVIGKAAMEFTGIRTNSVMGLDYLDDYDAGTLKFFDVLVLSSFGVRDKTAAEKLITDYVKRGGTVVVDLQGFRQNVLEENPSFLGVTSYATTKSGRISLENMGVAKAILPTEVSPPQKRWRFVTYQGLDETLSKLKGGDRTQGVLGYKRIGRGRVLFVGLNLLHYAYLTHDAKAFKLIDTLVPPTPSGRKYDIKLSKTTFQPENKHISFGYNAKTDTPLIVSVAYSPHWKAYLDDKEMKVNNMEDLLFLVLPKGKHVVEVRYVTTPIHFIAIAISVLTLFSIGALTHLERKRATSEKVSA